MAGNNSIQFLRGTSQKRRNSNQTLLPGQPFYETDTNQLYIGNGTILKNAKPLVNWERGGITISMTNQAESEGNTSHTNVDAPMLFMHQTGNGRNQSYSPIEVDSGKWKGFADLGLPIKIEWDSSYDGFVEFNNIGSMDYIQGDGNIIHYDDTPNDIHMGADGGIFIIYSAKDPKNYTGLSFEYEIAN